MSGQYTPPPRVGDAAPRRHRGLARIPVVGPVCIMVVVASLWLGWQRYFHPPVPAALSPWMEHNQGVVYRPQGTTLSVSLPSMPNEMTVKVVFGPGRQGSARVARSVAGDHEILVVWLVAPADVLNSPGSDPVTLAADFAGRAGGFKILVPRNVQHHGRPAIEGVIDRDGLDGRALVVLDGNSVFAVLVSGATEPEAGFEFLVDSFGVGPAPQ